MPIAYLPFSTAEPRATPPQDYLNVPTTPREFGAGVAQGLQTLGAGTSHAGQVFGEMAADDQSNQAISGLAEINANLRNLQGKDRMDAYPQARQQMDDLVNKTRGNLTTINQTLEFDRQVRYLHAHALREAGDLYDQAEQHYGLGVAKAKALVALNGGSQAIVSNDPDTVTHNANLFIDARMDEAKRQFGSNMGDDVRNSIITNARREYMEGLVRTLMVTPGHESDAQTMLDNNRSLFSGTPGYDALSNSVKAHAFKGQVDGLVAGAISGNMPAPSPGGGTTAGRNIANNNPGNIKSPGGGWMSYPTPEAGVAAIDSWLQRAQANHGLTTVRQLIDDPQHGYAPSADPGNAGKGLPIQAAKIVGVSPDQPVDMGDPVTRSKMVNAILNQEQGPTIASKYMAAKQAATDLGAQGGLVPSGAITPAYRSQGLTDALDRIEASNAPPEAKELAAQRVERHFRDQQIEQDRYEAQVRRQQKDASDARANQIVTAMADPTQHVTVGDIRSDPALEWQTKEHLIGALAAHPGGDPAAAAQAYGPGFWDAYKGVTASAEDPDKISDPNAILRRAGPGGDLTLAGAEKLSSLVTKVSKPEHLGDAKIQAGAMAYAKHQLSFEADYGTFKVRDPKGEDTFNIGFTPAFFKYWEGGIAAGKTPQELSNKAEIDKLVQPFKRSPADEMRDKLESGEETKPQALKIPTADELAKMGPQELVAAVRANPALRSQGEAIALKNGWIRAPVAPPIATPGTATAPIPP